MPPTSASPTALALLLLADGRFPAGGHAHSGGVESAVADGRVHDEPSLEAFTRGRVVTVGKVDAALAAAAVRHLATATTTAAQAVTLHLLDEEADARILVPVLRESSRRLGRQLARAAARCWPDSLLATLVDTFPGGAHQSVALGCVIVAVGGTPLDAALLTLHHAITMPAQAGVRLLGLDPFGVAAMTARLADTAAGLAELAVASSHGDLAELPAATAPLVDIAATDHARWDVRLFAT